MFYMLRLRDLLAYLCACKTLIAQLCDTFMQDEISRRADTGERRGEGIATFPQDVVLHNARRPFAAASQCL